MQSKHIVIYDTLIKQSKPDEVEAVLGKWHSVSDIKRALRRLYSSSPRTGSLVLYASYKVLDRLPATSLHHPGALPRVYARTSPPSFIRLPKTRRRKAANHHRFLVVPGKMPFFDS